MRRPKAIFFDLDETLITNSVTPDKLIEDIYREFLGATEHSRFDRFMKELLAHGNRMWEQMHDNKQAGHEGMTASFASAIEHIGGDTDLADTLFNEFLNRSSEETRLSENAVETLEVLRTQNFSLGIITNGLKKIQQAKIHRHGLSELVDTVVISEQAGAHKPDRKIFGCALTRIGLDANDAWHVGDHPENDVEGAINAGLAAVFYDPSGQRVQEAFDSASPKPDRVITDLFQLTEKYGR